MNKTILTLFIASAMFCSCNKKESFEERCEREAKETTQKQCPRIMDKYTTLDSVVFDKTERSMSYYHSINGELDDESKLTAEVIDGFRASVLEGIRRSVEMKEMKENKIKFNYYYRSQSTGKNLVVLNYTPEDYK